MKFYVEWGEIAPETLKKDEIEALLSKVAYQVLLDEQIKIDPEIDLTFVSPEEIHLLNKEYRGVDRPTDVLSFPQFDFEGSLPGSYLDAAAKSYDEIILGDIVISFEQAKAQAEAYGHSLERELAFLTAHSMLHLLGYDHMTEPEEQDMFARQEKALSELGITR